MSGWLVLETGLRAYLDASGRRYRRTISMTRDEDQLSGQTARSGVTRRGAISGAALIGTGFGLDRLLPKFSPTPARPPLLAQAEEAVVPFYGSRQAGISTSAQDFLSFAAFDMTGSAVEGLREILEQWTAAAARLTVGDPYQPQGTRPDSPPVDTGEVAGLGPSRLTVTIGLGPRLFDPRDAGGLGLTRLRPPELKRLPPFQGESLNPASSGGDLCVQACADDPQVAFHAVHVLSRLASSAATLRWTQQGFGRTSSTSRGQVTPRNLMGFKDGTDNIRAEDTQAMNEFVWARSVDEPRWMTGGTYLVARRIKILFDVWDATTLGEQQRTIGREKLSGAPLGSEGEYDPVNLQATIANGEPLLPANAHIRLASPHINRGQQILRRGYSYSEGVEPGSGAIDAGLFFIAFQRSPRRQFVPLQRRLAASDALSRHTLHTSSAIFACPPGARPGGFVGEELFA